MKGSGRIRGKLLAAAVQTVAAVLLRAPGFDAAAQPAPSAAPASAESPEQSIQRDLQEQAAILTGPNSKPEQREQAAERLLSRNREDARQILLTAIQDSSSRTAQAAQIAVARALAGDARPDARFIEPLRQLLSRDPVPTEAAVTAFTAYGDNPNVINVLIDFARDGRWPPRSRAIAIRGIGPVVNKDAAAFLIGLINNSTEDAQVRGVAADALGEMTGIQTFKRDVAAWNQWWNATQGQPNLNWEAAQYKNRAAHEEKIRREYQRLSDHVRELLAGIYRQSPEQQRTELLLGWMRDSDPAVRVVGPDLVRDDAVSAKRIPPTVIAQLRGMIGDSAVAVRKGVVGTLSVINDAESVVPLLSQLAVETDPDVKAAIAQTLARLNDPRAVGAILPLLNDPSTRVAEAAAVALRDLGPIFAKDAATTAQVSAALRAKLNAIQGQPGTEDVRAALLEAMSPLHDPALLRVFQQAISANDPRNTLKVRVAAAKGLGGMRDQGDREQAAQELSTTIRRDPDAPVRLEATRAIGNVASFFQAPVLYDRMNPREEPDPSVREEAWRILSTLFKKEDISADELIRTWADRFRSDPTKRLSVLEAARNKYLAAANNDPGAAKALASVQQNIGDAYFALEQWGQAAAAYRAALNYWDVQRNAQRDVAAQLSVQLLNAMLRQGNYPDAIQFAASRIAKSDQERGDMGFRIRNEVERLKKAGDFKNALQLIDETGKMQPPLSGLVVEQLDQLKREIQQKLPGDK